MSRKGARFHLPERQPADVGAQLPAIATITQSSADGRDAQISNVVQAERDPSGAIFCGVIGKSQIGKVPLDSLKVSRSLKALQSELDAPDSHADEE